MIWKEIAIKINEKLTLFALGLGVTVPWLYFGIQFVAAPFFPGYSFFSMDASTLGSELALYPFIFNVGAIITGVVTLVASLGFLRGLVRLGIHPVLAGLVSLAVLLNGLGSLWAGFIPLPDPRHGANPFAIGIFLFPPLLTAAIWKRKDAHTLKVYLIITHLLFIALIPVMSGVIGIDTQSYQGLLQRVAALIFYPPVGAGATYLLNRIKT